MSEEVRKSTDSGGQMSASDAPDLGRFDSPIIFHTARQYFPGPFVVEEVMVGSSIRGAESLSPTSESEPLRLVTNLTKQPGQATSE